MLRLIIQKKKLTLDRSVRIYDSFNYYCKQHNKQLIFYSLRDFKMPMSSMFTYSKQQKKPELTDSDEEVEQLPRYRKDQQQKPRKQERARAADSDSDDQTVSRRAPRRSDNESSDDDVVSKRVDKKKASSSSKLEPQRKAASSEDEDDDVGKKMSKMSVSEKKKEVKNGKMFENAKIVSKNALGVTPQNIASMIRVTEPSDAAVKLKVSKIRKCVIDGVINKSYPSTVDMDKVIAKSRIDGLDLAGLSQGDKCELAHLIAHKALGSFKKPDWQELDALLTEKYSITFASDKK